MTTREKHITSILLMGMFGLDRRRYHTTPRLTVSIKAAARECTRYVKANGLTPETMNCWEWDAWYRHLENIGMIQ